MQQDNFNVIREDLHNMQTWGRIYAQTRLKSALQNAAEYLVMAEPEEYSSLWYSWEEGVRNNVRDMHHFNKVMWDIKDLATFIKNNS